MKLPSPAKYRNCLVGLLILSLCMMPLLGLHLHLPATHMGDELHSHAVETHGFHLHATSHDSIDIEPMHQSDTLQISLDVESQLHKVIQLLALVTLLVLVMAAFAARMISTVSNLVIPLQSSFEVFLAMRRGPPSH